MPHLYCATTPRELDQVWNNRVFVCSDQVLREHAANEDAAGKDVFRPGGDVEDQLPHHL